MKNNEKKSSTERKRGSRRRSNSSNEQQRERKGGECHFILHYIAITAFENAFVDFFSLSCFFSEEKMLAVSIVFLDQSPYPNVACLSSCQK